MQSVAEYICPPRQVYTNMLWHITVMERDSQVSAVVRYFSSPNVAAMCKYAEMEGLFRSTKY